MVVTDAMQCICDVSTRPVNFFRLADWLLAHTCGVVLSRVSGNPFLSLISSLSSTSSQLGTGTRSAAQLCVHTRCTCPCEHRMIDDACVCVCA